MADKDLLQSQQLDDSDKSRWKEIFTGIYSRMTAAILYVGNTAVSSSNPLPVAAEKKTILLVTNTDSSAGDTAIIAAPTAGIRIVVTGFVVQNESSTATTMILKDGTTAKIRCLGQNQGDGLAVTFAPGSEWRLTAATALNLNLSGANQCGYSVSYFTEAV